MAIVGALIGVLLGMDGGFIVGGLLGFGGGLLWRQNTALKDLNARLDSMEEGSTGPAATAADAVAPSASAAPSIPVRSSDSSPPADRDSATQPAPRPPRRAAPPPQEPSALEIRLEGIRKAIVRFLTTGNPVVRIGAVVLFFGVAFLLRYAYEHSLVPVELRLAGAGLGGIVLLVLGWRLRERADSYGLILQGVGIGILYLTVFASARLYGLLPMGGAFAILVVLVAGACVLAVVQKSQALAIFSTSGGFLAPILTSTGEGSHVALFSYYALLNAGILGMAWFQHWRWLNWTGFVFTFVIGASWGYQYYQPEYFASTQPFLILFFAFYLAVSILFARRQTVELKGVIDGTLVFGTPVIAFVLQAGLVSDMEFGLAFSALGAAVTYTGLGVWLKRQEKIAGLLDESFVALAVVFVTLAIPLAFDNQRFTAATWALEGAGIVWVGLRQSQLLPRVFGILLQIAAGLAFIAEIGSPVEATLFLNSAFLGAAFLGAAGVFTAYVTRKHADSLRRFESPVSWIFLIWGTFWWLIGGLRELGLYTPGEEPFVASNMGEHLFGVYTAVSVGLLTMLARRIRWSQGLLPGFVLLPIAAAILVNLDINWERGTAFSDSGWLAWPVMFVVFYWHLRQVDGVRLAGIWHAAGWWFVALFATWNSAALVDDVLPGSVWTYVLWGAAPLAACVLLLELRERGNWPFGAFKAAYFGWGWMVGLGYLLAWLLATGLVAGDPEPLPYIVLFNPLELVQAAILVLCVFWLRGPAEVVLGNREQWRMAAGVIASVGFIWINFVALRGVHFYAEVPYPVERIAASDAFQTTVTILWTSVALLLMGAGTRRSLRVSWMFGAGLLAIVLLKLFFMDMSRLDLVARIVSFISVGVLMLVIGYFAPIPPKRMELESA